MPTSRCKDDSSNDPRGLIALIQTKACELLHSGQDYYPSITDDHWKNAEMIVEDSSAAPLIELIHKHRRLCARRQRRPRPSAGATANSVTANRPTRYRVRTVNSIK